MKSTMMTNFVSLVFITLLLSTTLIFLIHSRGNKLDQYWYSYYDPCYVREKETIDNLFCGEKDLSSVPVIYAITPTYNRYTQKSDLTRLTHTLKWICKLHWLVIEDGSYINEDILQLLKTSGLSFTYVPQVKDNKTNSRLKGIHQRNAAIDWIKEHHNRQSKAVFYFVDDDNTYTTEIFEQLRCTKKLSMWPVGLSGGRLYETPILKDGKVVSFEAWKSLDRKFAMDMAGFALNVDVLWKYPLMRFDLNGRGGFQETEFLEQCCTLDDIEPLADDCTKVLVWHTRTADPGVSSIR